MEKYLAFSLLTTHLFKYNWISITLIDSFRTIRKLDLTSMKSNWIILVLLGFRRNPFGQISRIVLNNLYERSFKIETRDSIETIKI